MWRSERQVALDRTYTLLERDPVIHEQTTSAAQEKIADKRKSVPESGLALALCQADISIPRWLFVAVALACAIAFAVAAAQVLAPGFVPLFAVAGFFAPFSWLENKISKRAASFAEDYPTVLLATSSSMKVGMTPYMALERSIKLLPRESLMREEVERLLNALRRGVSKDEALQNFGASIRQPDLALFRSAFLLVLEHGGKFAPTLHRLAAVSKDRAMLIGSARVSTATMRMTANVLVCIAPIVLLMVSLRSKNFWDIFFNNPTANFLASLGVVVIAGSYFVLRRMSSFRP